ncbi:Ca-activated chloride channel family protein [Saccharicrinis carchari]|uniref:Ca-activated chloride channel family protein n=1 Tax=Saccharicrinis carchari TaxID=1168039 RepID=A0A521B757_SACCC|nr:VWA domain-containing protein [Saccharicrinis carchari]SMO42510.1 Ca-activated chloride channel family protein [Saccharicrinis carchari]
MFRFEHPDFLYLLILIPVLAFASLLIARKRKRALQRFGNPELLEPLMPGVSAIRPVIKFYLILLALSAIIFTLAGPQFGTKLQTVKRKGIEIMIALDVSNSMNAQDIAPSRLDRAKRAIYQLVDKLQNDKVGLIVFAGEAYTQLPITTDYPSAKMFISSINTDIVPTQGTAIGAAIRRSMSSFSAQENVNRAIIVITDGENHEDDAIGAAKAAVEKGIKVYTVGMGLPKGAPIPIPGGGKNNFMKDREGNVVISKLDEAMLVEIAKAGDAEFIPANNIRKGINDLVDYLSKLEKTEMEAKIYTDYENQFQYIALIALIMLLIDFIVLERKNKYLSKIKLFEEEDKK